MSETVVGIGDICIGYENDTLIALGLGSCIGLILHDPVKKIGGLAHIMLPDSIEATFKMPERKVMIADKDHSTRKVIKNILLSNKFEVVMETEEKGQTLAHYSKLKPSVSLVSAFLPPTDGLDTIKTLMNLDNQVKAVVMSPPVEKDTILNYLTNGAQEVLLNPFTEQKVVGVVEFILYRKLLKFADRAIPAIVTLMMNRGSNQRDIVAKVVGGAHLFSTITGEEMQIGKRNLDAVERKLKQLGINVVASDVGSNIGRTARFDVGTGIVGVKTKDGEKNI
ncbi:response regulator [Candidatus Woesearchaeota archaeon]|nr:response regulator [Candidatus Woesearchaeota archaeon]